VVKIDGVCAECLAGGVVAPKSKEEEGGEKDAIVEYQYMSVGSSESLAGG